MHQHPDWKSELDALKQPENAQARSLWRPTPSSLFANSEPAPVRWKSGPGILQQDLQAKVLKEGINQPIGERPINTRKKTRKCFHHGQDSPVSWEADARRIPQPSRACLSRSPWALYSYINGTEAQRSLLIWPFFPYNHYSNVNLINNFGKYQT